jgi:hypothetical protein
MIPPGKPIAAARRLLAVLLGLGSALIAVAPATASADGDPASDVLLIQDVFYPYQPKVSPSLEKGLEDGLRALGHADGVHLKVAIIANASELGLLPEYFGRAQAYAQFLDREISFNQPQALLTVMPSGYGVVPADAAGALAGLRVDAGHGSDGLTRSAVFAVVALARHYGHPIATPSLTATAKGKSAPGVLVFGVPVALLALAGLFLLARRGRPRSDEDREDPA